jgi:hypothetical protein
MSGWALYLIIVLDNFKDLLGWSIFVMVVLSIISGIASIIMVCALADGEDDAKKWLPGTWTFFKRSMASLFIVATMYVATPNTKQMATIYILPKIVNRIGKSELPGELENYAIEWVKNQTVILKNNIIGDPNGRTK